MAQYPTSVANDGDLYIAVNLTSTSLTDNPLSAGATTVNVLSAAAFPSIGAITIGTEIIRYSGKTGTSFTGCTRGFDSSTAVSHAVTTPVYHYIIADHHNVLKDEIKAIEADLVAVQSALNDADTPAATATDVKDRLDQIVSQIKLISGETNWYDTPGASVSTLVSSVGDKLPLAGGTMTGNIAMSGTQKLTGLAAGTTNGDSVRYEQITPLAVDSTVVHNTGTENVGGAKTFTTQLIGKGTATNDSAAQYFIGEAIRSYVSATNTPANDVWGDMTSISLTAGDWDITLQAHVSRNTATWTRGDVGISTTSGNSGTGLTIADNYSINEFASSGTTPSNVSACIANYRVSLSSTTTYYAKVRANFSAGQPQYLCRLSARRVR